MPFGVGGEIAGLSSPGPKGEALLPAGTRGVCYNRRMHAGTPQRAAPSVEPPWQKNLTDYNEGLGVVYERMVLNQYLLELKRKYAIATVLEAPLYGMAGVTGINSVPLAQAGCAVTLMDSNLERLVGVQRIWGELKLEPQPTFVHHPDFAALPFADGAFDLVWAWAALWHAPDAQALIREMVRVSRRLVFLAMPNRLQIGYILRKFVLEPHFFETVDETWANIPRVTRVLRDAGLRIVDQGVMDVPPWPDTVMPAALVLRKLGFGSKKMTRHFEGEGWQWSTMDYYLGKRPELKAAMERYMFLERLPLPWQLKMIWAHHRYVLAQKVDLQQPPAAGTAVRKSGEQPPAGSRPPAAATAVRKSGEQPPAGSRPPAAGTAVRKSGEQPPAGSRPPAAGTAVRKSGELPPGAKGNAQTS
jgi:SAM-dependent methyltransferase